MKLHVAIAQLKEDGSNWIERDRCEQFNKLKITFSENEIFTYEKKANGEWWYTYPHCRIPAENWKLHTKHKFEVGDLVAYKRFGKDGEIFGKITEIYNYPERQSYAISASCFSHDESYLKLIMTAQELVEKLRGSE